MIEKGENGGVGAYAQCQGEDGDDRETGSACEGAESVFKIAKCGVEGCDGIHFADLIFLSRLADCCEYALWRKLFPRKRSRGLSY